MLIEIKVPSVGESVTEALLAQWFKKDGDLVKKDEPLFVIETDKVTLEVVAEDDGILDIKVPEGETVAIGAVVGTLDTATAASKDQPPAAEPKIAETRQAEPAPVEAKKPKTPEPAPEEKPQPPAAAEPQPAVSELSAPPKSPADRLSDQSLAPSVRRLIAEKGLDPASIPGTGPSGRITKGRLMNPLTHPIRQMSRTLPNHGPVFNPMQPCRMQS